MPLTLMYSERAREQIATFKRKGEASPETFHGKTWNALRRLLEDVISNPDHALMPKNALRDDLRGIQRDKLGRWRVFYVVSTARGIAAVLYVGWRKEGDRDDAYAEMTRLVTGGEFDLFLEEIGLPRRGRR